jgi:hypothetical protein
MAIGAQQSYLLNRLPSRYDLKTTDPAEPAKVQAARKVIEEYDAKRSVDRKEREKKWNDLLKEAKEAIYFKPAGDALKVVREVERQMELLSPK